MLDEGRFSTTVPVVKMMGMMITNGDKHDDDKENMICKYDYKMHYYVGII